MQLVVHSFGEPHATGYTPILRSTRIQQFLRLYESAHGAVSSVLKDIVRAYDWKRDVSEKWCLEKRFTGSCSTRIDKHATISIPVIRISVTHRTIRRHE